MSALSVLFIGGTGVISSACVAEAVGAGHDVTVLNRGQSQQERPLPDGVHELRVDIHDVAAARAALAGREFDAVAEFVAFTPAHVQADIDLFAGHVGQYVFISSASVYAKPTLPPVTESTPLANRWWQYSRDKIAGEDLLVRAFRDHGFPATIVRPSHTFDGTKVPLLGGWTAVARMRAGRPVVVHGDGTTRWPITHNTDFARAFVGLLGHPQAVGEAFHITTDEALTWDEIFRTCARAAGVAEPELVHVASESIAAIVPDWGPGLLGDKAHSMVFDNSKVKRLVPGWAATVPFWRGAREIVAWYDADPGRAVVDPDVDKRLDAIVATATR